VDTIKFEISEKTPSIEGSISDGLIVIKGRSYPEDAPEFFQPLRDWLADFYKNTPGDIHLDLDLDYINTATTVLLYEMIFVLSKLSIDREVKVTWKYEEDDYDMIDKGNDFKELLGNLITLVPRAEENSF
jgi:SiaC family regulatory phosphoprotein